MAIERKPVPKVRADGNTPKTDAELVELSNVVCPRCDSALCYSTALWLHCPRCTKPAPKLGTDTK